MEGKLYSTFLTFVPGFQLLQIYCEVRSLRALTLQCKVAGDDDSHSVILYLIISPGTIAGSIERCQNCWMRRKLVEESLGPAMGSPQGYTEVAKSRDRS